MPSSTTNLASTLSKALSEVAYNTNPSYKDESEATAAYTAYIDMPDTSPKTFTDTTKRYAFQMGEQGGDLYCSVFDTQYRLDDEGIKQLKGADSIRFFRQSVLTRESHAKRLASLPGLPVGQMKLEWGEAAVSARIYTPHAGIDPSYQGKGLAGSLYRLALAQGAVLLTKEHSADAKRLWDKLATLPGVSDAYVERTHPLKPWVKSNHPRSAWSQRMLLGKGRHLDEVLEKLNAPA